VKQVQGDHLVAIKSFLVLNESSFGLLCGLTR
jgi:hypothetical protein